MEKMLVTSIFSFSHNVFTRVFPEGHYKLGFCNKELTKKLGDIVLSHTET